MKQLVLGSPTTKKVKSYLCVKNCSGNNGSVGPCERFGAGVVLVEEFAAVEEPPAAQIGQLRPRRA